MCVCVCVRYEGYLAQASDGVASVLQTILVPGREEACTQYQSSSYIGGRFVRCHYITETHVSCSGSALCILMTSLLQVLS